jgi:hypothetical protein
MKNLKTNSLFNFLLVILVCISISTTKSQIIPTDRLYNWEGNVGVPGGIPNRTLIGATVDSVVYGNGTVDASSAIEAAIDLCPEGQVVYIPQELIDWTIGFTVLMQIILLSVVLELEILF